MALSNYERAEALLGIGYTVTAAASIGAVSNFSVAGYDILATLTTAGPFVLDVATVVSLAAVIVAFIELGPGGSTTDISGLETGYQAAILATLGLTAYGSANPAFAASEAVPVQFALLGVSVAGYWALAYN